MPMKLNVGISRKVGLPDYGSLGASCNLDVELDSTLLSHDRDALQTRIREAYTVAHQAVHEELDRLQTPEGAAGNGTSRTWNTNGVHEPASAKPWPTQSRPRWGGPAAGRGGAVTTRRPSTPNQVRAILALARQAGVDLDELLQHEHGLQRPEDLSRSDASALIDRLKASVGA